MKEVFEKIIERLKERKKYLMNDFVLKDVALSVKENALGRIDELGGAIEIISQVAEEYKELTITTNQLTESNPKIEEFLNEDSPYTVEFTWCDNAVKNNGWISCSERLPEEAYGCLVTVMDYEPMTGQEFENILPYFAGYDGHAWYDSDGQEIPFEIIAWQPIPEPYQPKGE